MNREEQYQIQNLLHDCKLRFEAQRFGNKIEIRNAADERRKALKQIDDWTVLLQVVDYSPDALAVEDQLDAERILTPDEQREVLTVIADLQCAVLDLSVVANRKDDPAIQAILSKLDEVMAAPRARGVMAL